MKIKQFFENEYIQFANNDNFQSLANYIDGFKPTARKTFYTFTQFINKKIKVAQFASKTSEMTQYLGGENNINGVIINLTKSFIGANNIPIYLGNGHFGDRFYPKSAAAPRYIFVSENKTIDNIFNKDDYNLLIKQKFEGYDIEPRYYVPILPMILINGSEGIGTGFSQKILPRNKDDIIKGIRKYLESNIIEEIKPYYNNYKGSFVKIENKWLNRGILKLKESKRGFDYLIIEELPIDYNLTNYLKKIEKLLEDKKIIDYTDLSNDEIYKFEVKVKSGKDLDFWYKELKLETTFTENFTSIDENNKIIEFKSFNELFEKFIKVRLDYYSKRKEYLLNKYKKEIEDLEDRMTFIQLVMENKIVISKRKKDDIIKDCIKYNIKNYDNHLRMNLLNLTDEKIDELNKNIKKLKSLYNKLKNKTEKELWNEELDILIDKLDNKEKPHSNIKNIEAEIDKKDIKIDTKLENLF